jgi:hypothetical protein
VLRIRTASLIAQANDIVASGRFPCEGMVKAEQKMILSQFVDQKLNSR